MNGSNPNNGGNRSSELVYWDSCIFIAYISGEKRAQSELDGIDEQIERFDKNRLNICTSVITIAEVLRNRSKNDLAYSTFLKVTQRRNFLLSDVNRRITEIAHDIRNYSSKNKGTDADTLTLPDALHLATSIHHQCSILYTFDKTDKPGKSKSLVPLSGTIAGQYFQIIKVPEPGPDYQPKLPGI